MRIQRTRRSSQANEIPKHCEARNFNRPDPCSGFRSPRSLITRPVASSSDVPDWRVRHHGFRHGQARSETVRAQHRALGLLSAADHSPGNCQGAHAHHAHLYARGRDQDRQSSGSGSAPQWLAVRQAQDCARRIVVHQSLGEAARDADAQDREGEDGRKTRRNLRHRQGVRDRWRQCTRRRRRQHRLAGTERRRGATTTATASTPRRSAAVCKSATPMRRSGSRSRRATAPRSRHQTRQRLERGAQVDQCRHRGRRESRIDDTKWLKHCQGRRARHRRQRRARADAGADRHGR
jgi:hypothetical protein